MPKFRVFVKGNYSYISVDAKDATEARKNISGKIELVEQETSAMLESENELFSQMRLQGLSPTD